MEKTDSTAVSTAGGFPAASQRAEVMHMIPDASSTRDLTFGRYETIAKIGEGASGLVLLARARGEAGFERLFAVKVLHRDNPEVSSALVREAQLACRIQHRNVVSVVDVGANRDGPYLVMEYVEGCTLSDLNARSREQRPPRLVLPILVDALFGLHAIHTCKDEQGASLGLVHRDVSPQNLLVGVDGASRISDFGIAAPHNRVRQTRTDRVRGTPGYLSPEQVVGGELDRRSDLFSAGVVLWNTLTGKKLFDGPTEHASLFHVLKRKIPRPSQAGLRPPAAFDALVLRALERDPARRFQSAEEMAIALRDAAMRAGALGAPSEVAGWVTTMFGVELEARRRAIRDVTAQRTVPRLDGERPSMSGLSIALPRLKSATQSASDAGERLSLDDLSLQSDELSVVRNLLGPGAAWAPGDAMEHDGSQRRWGRRTAITAIAAGVAAVLLLGGGGWLLTRSGPEPEKPTTVQPLHGATGASAASSAASGAAAATPAAAGATAVLPAAGDPATAATPATATATDPAPTPGPAPIATGERTAAPTTTTTPMTTPAAATPARRGDRRTGRRTPAATSNEPAAATNRPADPTPATRPTASEEVEGNPYIYKK
jgi:eukaryotic-like serine/threonine-protein kinase